MTEAAPASCRRLCLVLFWLSGFSGLIYQVLWTRMFTLVLGTTTYAVATVLAVFMGGLALGSFLFGKLADRPATNGLRMYGFFELAIGVYALCLPFLMALSDSIYRAAWPVLQDSFAGQMALRVGLCAAILLLPTTLMGGTLPALSRYLCRSYHGSGSTVGALYALNTLGAVVGCFLTGFFLIELLGLHATLMLAATVNLAIGAAALLAGRGPAPRIDEVEELEDEEAGESPARFRRSYRPSQVKLAVCLFAVSGFAALALEVLWTRSLMYFVSIDTWAFTAMLTAFLTGISAGSLLMSAFVGRIRDPLLWLGVIELSIGVAAAASIPLFGVLFETFDTLGSHASGSPLATQIVYKLSQSFVVMAVPTLLMGAAFPLITEVYLSARRQVGRGTGTLYALNTVGAIVGSFGAAFALIPLLGIQRSILLMATLYAVFGAVILVSSVERRVRLWAALGGGLIALVLIGLCATFTGTQLVRQGTWFQNENRLEPNKVVFYHEGSDATLAVVENPRAVRLLNINGIVTAADNYMDMQVHRMLSHLPMLLHPDPQDVLVVGFGMGSTVYGCCQHPVERVDVVELLRAEKQTAPFFETVNHGVLDDPKLNFIVGDGRNYILATDRRYDVISFNAIHPRYSANLYTWDFYRLCAERLTDDGIVCAWMTQNSMTDDEWLMICRSMTEAFPHASLWYCNPEHFCLVASPKPLRVDFARWQQRMAAPGVSEDLADSMLQDSYVLATRHLLGDDALRAYIGPGPMNTDDRPRVEFARELRPRERDVILRLCAQRQPVADVLASGSFTEAEARRLETFARATTELILGQTEHWYAEDPSQREMLRDIHFLRALRLTPDNQDVRANLNIGTGYRTRLAAGLRRQPANPELWSEMGRVLLLNGDLEGAASHLAESRRLKPNDGETVLMLGIALLFDGDAARSTTLLGPLCQALQSAPNVEVRTRVLALCAFAAGLERQGAPPEQVAELRKQADRLAPAGTELFSVMQENAETMRSRGRCTRRARLCRSRGRRRWRWPCRSRSRAAPARRQSPRPRPRPACG